MRQKKLPMGALENAVMEILWASNGWMTPGEVHAILERERPLSYTTVTTILVRLGEKGRLERRRDGRAFAYHPTATRAEWTAGRMGEVLSTFKDTTATLAYFVERLDDDERSQLRRLLAGREKR